MNLACFFPNQSHIILTEFMVNMEQIENWQHFSSTIFDNFFVELNYLYFLHLYSDKY